MEIGVCLGMLLDERGVWCAQGGRWRFALLWKSFKAFKPSGPKGLRGVCSKGEFMVEFWTPQDRF